MARDSTTVASAVAAAERTVSAEQRVGVAAVQTAVAGMTTMDPINIPEDRALAALLRQVVGVAPERPAATTPFDASANAEVDASVEAVTDADTSVEPAAEHPSVTAEDEELLISFQQASRLCERVFPATVAAQQVTAALAHLLPFHHVQTHAI